MSGASTRWTCRDPGARILAARTTSWPPYSPPAAPAPRPMQPRRPGEMFPTRPFTLPGIGAAACPPAPRSRAIVGAGPAEPAGSDIAQSRSAVALALCTLTVGRAAPMPARRSGASAQSLSPRREPAGRDRPGRARAVDLAERGGQAERLTHPGPPQRASTGRYRANMAPAPRLGQPPVRRLRAGTAPGAGRSRCPTHTERAMPQNSRVAEPLRFRGPVVVPAGEFPTEPGVTGLGRVGSCVAGRLGAFGTDVVPCSPCRRNPEPPPSSRPFGSCLTGPVSWSAQ